MVRTERLIEDLWADEAVATARNTLQTKVSRLRRALGDAALVTGTSAGYTLRGRPERGRCARGASPGRAGLDASKRGRRSSAALETCATALAMFRGDILSGAGDARLGHPAPRPSRGGPSRSHRGSARGAARSRCAGDVIGELEALVRVHPLREGLWALLMVALYRDGRQADALATYQRARNWLADELGLDPGLQLQQLEQQILVHDPSLGAAASPRCEGSGRRGRSGTCRRCRSSSSAATTEVAAVVDLLADARLVEIVGPGGVGKTAVAIAAGRALSASRGRRPGGVWLARLETAATADDVVDTLVAALNVGGEAALFERLKSSAAVVILDNCEHVIDAAAALAVRLLDAAPGLRILCTSQVPLDVDGEVVFELAPLALADAVALFTRRARRAAREPRDRAHRTTPCRSCADRSMVCPWRSSSPRREPRRCRSRRSPDASTIASAC